MFQKSFASMCLLLIAVSVPCLVAISAEPVAWQPAPTEQVIVSPANVDFAAASAAATASKPKAASRSFKNTLSAAAAQAHKEGAITRWQLARLRMAIAFRPDAMAEAQACCVDQAMNDGLMRSGADGDLDGFDWTGLLAFLKEFLPMILQIIAILG